RAKNNLTAEDAAAVEKAFQDRLRVLAPELYVETSPSGSATAPERASPDLPSTGSDPQPPPAHNNSPVWESQTSSKHNGGPKPIAGLKDLALTKLRRSRDKDH